MPQRPPTRCRAHSTEYNSINSTEATISRVLDCPIPPILSSYLTSSSSNLKLSYLMPRWDFQIHERLTLRICLINKILITTMATNAHHIQYDQFVEDVWYDNINYSTTKSSRYPPPGMEEVVVPRLRLEHYVDINPCTQSSIRLYTYHQHSFVNGPPAISFQLLDKY